MSKAWKPQTTIACFETSIYWQEYVARETKDPEQRKRCTERANAMKAEVKAMQSQVQS